MLTISLFLLAFPLTFTTASDLESNWIDREWGSIDRLSIWVCSEWSIPISEEGASDLKNVKQLLMFIFDERVVDDLAREEKASNDRATSW